MHANCFWQSCQDGIQHLSYTRHSHLARMGHTTSPGSFQCSLGLARNILEPSDGTPYSIRCVKNSSLIIHCNSAHNKAEVTEGRCLELKACPQAPFPSSSSPMAPRCMCPFDPPQSC
jgi:hypothetical protein